MSAIKDLAEEHQPLSQLFKQPESKAEWDQYALSEAELQSYQTDGYVSGIKLLEEWQADVLLEDLNKVRNPDNPSHELFYEFHSNESSDPEAVLFHSLGHWRITEGFHDVLWNPAFLKAASQLLGNRSVRFWHDQLFCKPARHGGVVAWHQDFSYWTRTTAMQHLTCWVALDDATVDNGCLHYIPGSHQWGLLEKPELAGDMEGIMEYLSEDQKKAFKPVPIELKKGYATFHHPLLMHGSFENRSDRKRRAFVLNVFADGTKSNTNEVLLNGVPIIPKGEKMQGKFFPLLYETP
ncbi:MAG: phytanoyl-CoA dioxygenase family protein [Bacteroidota bacterium]